MLFIHVDVTKVLQLFDLDRFSAHLHFLKQLRHSLSVLKVILQKKVHTLVYRTNPNGCPSCSKDIGDGDETQARLLGGRERSSIGSIGTAPKAVFLNLL